MLPKVGFLIHRLLAFDALVEIFNFNVGHRLQRPLGVAVFARSGVVLDFTTRLISLRLGRWIGRCRDDDGRVALGGDDRHNARNVAHRAVVLVFVLVHALGLLEDEAAALALAPVALALVTHQVLVEGHQVGGRVAAAAARGVEHLQAQGALQRAAASVSLMEVVHQLQYFDFEI